MFCQSILEVKVDGLFASLVQQLLEAIFHMELDYDDRGNVLGEVIVYEMMIFISRICFSNSHP